tara:strand:+ start:190 stop:1206 length:1017 start_codon:yes stop_codon:yes gene_type:complete
MARYASGRKSKAISDISGFKVRYTSLKTTYDGLRVEPEEFDVKHPQLTPAKNVFDATALFQPRPDNAEENVKLFLQFNPDIFSSKIEKSQKGIGVKAKWNIETLPRSSFNFGADVTGLSGATALGTLSISTQVAEEDAVGSGAVGVVNYKVNILTISVVSGNPSNHPYYNVGSTNKYAIGGSTATADVEVDLIEGNTYRFDQSDSSNSGHPLRFSTTANGSHASGSEYTTGVTTSGTPGSSGAYTQIVVATDAPTLYYYCTQHSSMGWTANTPVGTVGVTLSITETGLAGTGAIGGATLVANPVETGLAGTGAIGDATGISISGWGQLTWGQGTWGDG